MVKTMIFIPTYWGRSSETGWQLGDRIYDHPTPIDQEGTLGCLLDSMEILQDSEFDLVILAAVTAPELIDEAYNKVKSMLLKRKLPGKAYLLGERQLEQIRAYHFERKDSPSPEILSLNGYSNIRNMCLYSAYLLEADVAILIDDDEIFEDPEFMDKAHEFIGGRLYGQTVDGVAGYYLNKNNDYYDDVEIEPWMTFWNRFGSKRKAFDKIIGGEPRLKKTPFAFGGLMVIHRNLFRIVPFDPELTRGEDIDYVINARMFGFNFFLDSQLNIKHLSPGKKHPVWQHFRQDIYRFFYERVKINTQEERPNMILVEPEDFDPYPGEFLKDDLDDKVFKTNIILALDYLSNNQIEDCKATIKNIYLSKYDAVPRKNVFREYLEFHKKWLEVLQFAKSECAGFKNVLTDAVIKKPGEIEVSGGQEGSGCREGSGGREGEEELPAEIYRAALGMPFFKSIKMEETEKLIRIFQFAKYPPDETILEKGRDDDSVYLVIKGRIKIVDRSSESEKEIQLAELKEGDVFGLTSLVSSKSTQYLADVVAVNHAVVAFTRRQHLLSFFAEYPEAGVKLALYLMQELNNQLEDLIDVYTEAETKSSDISERLY